MSGKKTLFLGFTLSGSLLVAAWTMPLATWNLR